MRVRVGAMAVCAAMAMALTPVASAAVLFNDDFSQDTIDSPPALQAGEAGKRWHPRTATGAADHVHVVTDDPADPTNKHLRLERDTLFGYAHAQLTDTATTSTVDGLVEVAFRFYIPTTVTTGEFRVLGSPDNTAGDVAAALFTGNAFSVRFQPNATDPLLPRNVSFIGGANVGTAVNATWMQGEWNTVLITIDYDLGQFNVQVTNSSGTTTSNNRTFQESTVDRLGTVQFTTPANDSFARVDDVSVTLVPEPASLALLGLGGLAMLRRRD